MKVTISNWKKRWSYFVPDLQWPAQSGIGVSILDIPGAARRYLCAISAGALSFAGCADADREGMVADRGESPTAYTEPAGKFTCETGEVIGFETLLQHHRAVLVGELHGTAQMPAAFAELVERAVATERRVAVALEFDRRWQADIEAVISAADRAAAEAAFSKHATMDGRTSAAMRGMLYRLRELKASGADIHVFAIDYWQGSEEVEPLLVPDWIRDEVDVRNSLRDIRMGEKSVSDCLSVDCDTLIYYAGNAHTVKVVSKVNNLNPETGELIPFIRANAGAVIANELPTVSINFVHAGGSFKARTKDGFRVHNWTANVPPYVSEAKQITCADKKYHHDAVYNVGEISASSDPTQENP